MILRRNGGWCVELQQPLKGQNREWNEIEIRPATADTIIRWGQMRIPSTLALLSELCDVPERVLRQLPATEFDRVLLALLNIVPSVIKQDLEAGNRPLATPDEELELTGQGAPPPDPVDPRFPAHDGPVTRMPRQPAQPEVSGDAVAMNTGMPDVMHPVAH